MRHLRNAVAGFYFALLFGCALGTQLTTFEDKAAYAAILIDKVATQVGVRYDQGAISRNQGLEIKQLLSEAQDTLELANDAYKAGSFRDANASIDYTIVLLTDLEKRLKP